MVTNKETIYITQTCFEDMSKNLTQLIEVLNHRMTSLELDVSWIKKLGYYICGTLTAIAIKSIFFV
jgi:hypothetical protein